MFTADFAESAGERILKIGQYVSNLWEEYCVLFFLLTGYINTYIAICNKNKKIEIYKINKII